MYFNKEHSEENINNTSTILSFNHIDAVMVRDFTLSTLDCELDSWSSQTKDSQFGNCCFSARYVALMKKSRDWLALNQDNMSEWCDMIIIADMSTHRLLFQWSSTITIHLSVLVWYKTDIMSSNIICSRHDMAEKLLI